MGLFDFFEQQQAADRYAEIEEHHEASLSHELLAGAAAFAAAKAYQSHLEENGEPQSHENAKALMAGLAAAFIDREIETKGLDWLDAHRAREQAQDQAMALVDQSQWSDTRELAPEYVPEVPEVPDVPDVPDEITENNTVTNITYNITEIHESSSSSSSSSSGSDDEDE